MMSFRSLVFAALLLGCCGSAFAQADLSGSWSLKMTPEGGAPRGARTLPQTIDIKQNGDKIDITTLGIGDTQAILFACSLKSGCKVARDERDWWVRWDGAELVLELRHIGSPASTLHRLYLAPDKQNLLVRALDDPKAIAFPYLRKK
jgi:hypothetical protein